MSRRMPEADLQAIVAATQREDVGIAAIEAALSGRMPRRTLQYRLRHLVDSGRLVAKGRGRWMTYGVPAGKGDPGTGSGPSLSEGGAEVRNHVTKPIHDRRPVAYDRRFLDAYRPNASAYLTRDECARLRGLAAPGTEEQLAGACARRILERPLVDLSWNSSRLEGNTYSLLDTRRLIAFGHAAEGKHPVETRMILNHKRAIEFLVSQVDDIGFNRHTILNLHAILADGLLADPLGEGRLRHMAVGIAGSVFHPLEIPHLIEECFDQVLASAEAIEDPFEQALFVMVQLPCLQPFEDVNKRVSRLAANIPLIRHNLVPLTFCDVPERIYAEAVLGIYELGRTDLMKDVFLWACERSATRRIPGDPDPFRFRHREGLSETVARIVGEGMNRKAAFEHIRAWAGENVDEDERERFRELAENEILGLHEGNFARHRIRLSQFRAWQPVWSEFTPGV